MARKSSVAAVPLQHRPSSIVGRPVKPGFVEMLNPSLVTKPPSGPKWAHEIEWDGYRAQAHFKGKNAKMFRHGSTPRQKSHRLYRYAAIACLEFGEYRRALSVDRKCYRVVRC